MRTSAKNLQPLGGGYKQSSFQDAALARRLVGRMLSRRLEFELAVCANCAQTKPNSGRIIGSNCEAATIAAKEPSDMVEKIIDLIGVSTNSIEDAVQIALARAGVTISGIHQAHVEDISAVVENNRVSQWRVAIKVSFMVKDQLHE
jgi:dodecin